MATIFNSADDTYMHLQHIRHQELHTIAVTSEIGIHELRAYTKRRDNDDTKV